MFCTLFALWSTYGAHARNENLFSKMFFGVLTGLQMFMQNIQGLNFWLKNFAISFVVEILVSRFVRIFCMRKYRITSWDQKFILEWK